MLWSDYGYGYASGDVRDGVWAGKKEIMGSSQIMGEAQNGPKDYFAESLCFLKNNFQIDPNGNREMKTTSHKNKKIN